MALKNDQNGLNSGDDRAYEVSISEAQYQRLTRFKFNKVFTEMINDSATIIRPLFDAGVDAGYFVH